MCLARVQSEFGHPSAARQLVGHLYRTILGEQRPEYTGRFAYFIQILGQTYANLGDLTIAANLYQRAIAFAEESHYLQVKAKALSGLAECDRRQSDLDIALPRHREAIRLLEEIGAKCDLAEAHYQIGPHPVPTGTGRSGVRAVC